LKYTVNQGDNTFILIDDVCDYWKVNDYVAVASSSFNHKESEQFIIQEIGYNSSNEC